MFGYVIDLALKFARALTKRKITNLLILHHASGRTAKTKEEGAQIVRDYNDMHIRKGNRAIDYNACTGGDGSTFWGRGLEYEGGHVLNSGKSAGMNARSIGHCALGDFEHNQMPVAQKEAIKRFARDCCQKYGITQIIRHKDVKNTDCPGRYYPFEEIKAYALNHNIQPEPEGDDPLLWKVAVGVLNFRKSASTSAKILEVLHKGDLVKLDRYVKGEKWARVWRGDVLGYVWLSYIGER